ncbi:MAG: hypothetical protein MRY83_11175, partial [Flavobacteriales bacterium]|nr:hypothetical protein [Flavobacteriales bacterium]
IIESFAVALTFLFLLWSFRSILNANNSTFAQSHGRVSEANYYSVKTIWGSPHHQEELGVAIYANRAVEEEYGTKNDGTPLYRTVIKEVFQSGSNPIAESNGVAKLTLNERKKGSALYAGYNLEFKVNYTIQNIRNERVHAYFNFSLPEQVMYDSLKVVDEGKDLSGGFNVGYSGLEWNRYLEPNEKINLEISYLSRGLDNFYYVVSQPREINNFNFRIEIDKLKNKDVNYPENCLTPHNIGSTADGEGSVLSWNLHNAITTSGMGVELSKPEQPGAKVALVLRNSPYALMLLITMISITMLVLGKGVNFLEISLLSALYCLLFFAIASLSDYVIGFWGALILGSALTLYLTSLLTKKLASKFLKNAILILVTFFTVIYPLSGLWPDLQGDFKIWVTIVLTIYIFFISMRKRATADAD